RAIAQSVSSRTRAEKRCGLPELLTLERRAFEHIPVIRARACHETPQGSEHVGRDKRRAPPFVLADVHSLVSARLRKDFAVATQNDMSEGDGHNAAAQRNAMRQCPRDEWSVQFEHAVDKFDASPRECGGGHENESNQAVGKRPKVPSQ